MWNLKLIVSFLVVGLSLAYGNDEDDDLDFRMFTTDTKIDLDGRYKYHVAILQVLPNDTNKIVCGGAIIGSHFVLTAAHCVYNKSKQDFLIRSGWDLTPQKPELEERSYHKVARIMYLKDYFQSPCRHHQHDIAILKTKKSFDLAFDSQYKKVNLPDSDNEYENDKAIFTGYGIYKIIKYIDKKTDKIVKEEPGYSKELRYITTTVITNEECQKNASVIITQSNICTQANNTEGFSCLGDNGGPLVKDGVVIGIRNAHNNICDQAKTEMFTRVSTYVDFIKKVLDHEYSHEIVYV